MNLNPLSLAIVNPRGAGVAAALFEDFTNSAVDFDSSITFTRGSQATYFNSTGTLKFAPSNMIRNNTMVGAVPGTPGTLPTNWFRNNSSGLALSVVGTGTDSGIDYIDVSLSGTTSGTGSSNVYFDTNTGIAAVTSQTWILSNFVKIQAGSASNITAFGIGLIENTSAGAAVAVGQVAITPVSGSLSSGRVSFSRTLSGGATVGALWPFLQVSTTGIVTVDITLRIGLPQLQMGSDATPAIRTSGSAVYLPRSNAYQDYNPSTLAPLGFLIEEQRSNLFLRSEEFDNASWSKTNATITANSITSPSGVVNADTLTITAAGGAISQTTQSFTAGSTITFAIFAKKNTSNFMRFEIGGLVNCWFNLNTGATATNNAGSGNVLFSAKSIQAINNGWHRCSLTVTTSVLTTLNVLIFATDADNNTSSINSSIYLWGAQAEVGAFATSYIATSAAAATRLADSASITGTNFSSWYNQSEGTFVTKTLITRDIGAADFPCDWQASDGTTNNKMVVGSTNSTGIYEVTVGGVAQVQIYPAESENIVKKRAFAYKLNDYAVSLNGAAVTTDTSATVPTVNKLNIGSAFNNAVTYNGWISSIAYFRTRLPNANLQSVTT